MDTENTIIGIDLGTTYSAVAVFREGKVEVIANDQGERTTPSYVAFTDSERLIGAAAKAQSGFNAQNTIFDSKRLIGRHFSDATVQADIKHWPFKVKKGANDKPKISVQYKGKMKDFTPEEISAMILTNMKDTAEQYLGYPIKKAVITVPAYFNDAQRRATKDAGTIAGLTIERIINEPTAAAIAYGLDKQADDEKNVLIFDLGGGTHDTSLLTLDNGLFEVKATNGLTHMGGQDFDNKIVQWCFKEFQRKNKGVDIEDAMKNKKTLTKLKSAAEKAKKVLSSSSSTRIEIDSLYDGIDFAVNLTRAKFEGLCADDFKKCLEPVDKVLKDAKMNKSDVTDIVLVGGSTRIPKIKELLRNYFGKEPKQDINPDEAVAYGAAVQGAVLAKSNDSKIRDLVLIDVIPLSLGIETAGGQMAKIIQRNTSIPCNKEQVFSTYTDNQPGVTIKIFEGEREFTKYNNLLGTFELTEIPPMPRGIPKIMVKFDIDANGILNVSATEESTNKNNKIIIKNDKNRFTPEELEAMIKEAEKFAEDDRINKERIDARNSLENYVYNIRNSTNADEFKSRLTENSSKKITEIVNETIHWVEENPELEKEEYFRRQKEVEEELTPLIMEVYQSNDDDDDDDDIEIPFPKSMSRRSKKKKSYIDSDSDSDDSDSEIDMERLSRQFAEFSRQQQKKIASKKKIRRRALYDSDDD